MAKKPSPARACEDVWIPSACDMCYNSCAIRVHRVDGVAVKIEGIPGAPPNYGKLCAKGNAALMSLYNPHRLTRPLVRTNPEKGIGVEPGWKEVAWEEALDLLVARLQTARASDPRSLVGASFDVHSLGIFRAFLGAFGTPNGTTVSAGFFCGNGVHPVAYLLTGANDLHPDLGLCNYLLMFGTSYGFVAQTNAMGLAQEMAEARARGLKLVVVDPVCSYAASKADEWIPIRPGTDAAFALSLMHVLVNELGCYDRDFLTRYTNATYLIGPDGHYLRDSGEGKPLVWDARAGQAVPFDGGPPTDMALEGSYQVAGGGPPILQPLPPLRGEGEPISPSPPGGRGGEGVRGPLPGVEAKPGFQLLKEHLRAYLPEKVAQITTVPAATIRRVAKELGEAARIGATIRLQDHDLPYRPAAAIWYRGISAHKHGMLNGVSVGLINALLGSIDVPGGLLGTTVAGPFWGPQAGPDGLLVPGNPITRRTMRPSLPPRKVQPPETLELVELFPVSVYARAMLWLGILYPEQFGLPYRAEVLIHCRTNLMATTGDPAVLAEALKRIPFMVSFATHHDETTQFADLVLPDCHGLERLALLPPYYQYYNAPMPHQGWYGNLQQPIVQPPGEARYWIEVLLEVADRLGILDDLYTILHTTGPLKNSPRPDPGTRYTWEDICDRSARFYFGEAIGLPHFREHGYYMAEPRRVQEAYPRVFHPGRIPVYLEHFLAAGKDVKKFTEERQIPWDTSDYLPLPEWRPCPACSESPPDFDLFVVNQKLPFLTFSFTSENPWLMGLAECNSKVFPVGINAETARRKGIADGDPIVLETPGGRKARAVARLLDGIHPECLATPGILGRWITANERTRGKGVHFNSLIEYTVSRLDTLSAALDACVRVRVTKDEGRRTKDGRSMTDYSRS